MSYFLTLIENMLNFQFTFQSAIVAVKRLEEFIEYNLDKNKEKLKLNYYLLKNRRYTNIN